MTLGFLLFEYFPYGGLQRDCLQVASLCAKRGHKVTILTRVWGGPRPDDVRVESLGSSGWSNVGRNQAWISRVQHRLSLGKFEGVIGFNKLPGLDVYYGSDPCYVAKAARLRPAFYRLTQRYRHFANLERCVFARDARTQILLLTPDEIPVYREIYGTEQDRFHILPPGIVRRKFSAEKRDSAREDIRKVHGWNETERILLLVGSGFRVKGVDRAITALAALTDEWRRSTRLVVIGGRNSPRPFQRQARSAGVGDRVHFPGGQDNIDAWLLGADLLIHPAYSESAGIILLEALSCGLPVLTTDTCGYAFHVGKADAGIVLPSPYRQRDCNARLAEMLTSPRRGTWSANGLAYAAAEDLYSCHQRAVEIIETTVNRKQDE